MRTLPMDTDEERLGSQEQQRTSRERACEFVGMLVGDWRPSKQQVLQWIRVAVIGGLALLIVLLILNAISSLADTKLIDLLKALALPITIGAAVPLLNWLQKKRELEIENQRAQDEALQD